MSITVNLAGQEIIINEFNNLVKINIDSPFQDPSYRMPQWDFHCSGFGINNKIIEFVLAKKMRLFVHSNEDGKDYIIDYDKLIDFLERYDVDYIVKETKLKIIPTKYFRKL